MANPFFVQPVDISGPLSGLGETMREVRAQKEQQQAKQRAQQRFNTARKDIMAAYKTGDPMAVAEASLMYPEFQTVTKNMVGILDEKRNAEAVEFMTRTLSAESPAEAADIMRDRIQYLDENGRDSSDTRKSLANLMKNPAGEMKAIQMYFASTNPDAYKAYQEANKVEPAETREIKRGDRIVTEQWDGEKWVQIADADRFNPNSSPRVDVKVNTGSDKFTEEVAKGDASRFQAISDAGQTASRNRVRIDRLDKLLQNTGSGFTTQMKSLAGSYGIPTEGLDDIQAAEAIISSLIPEQRAPGSGQMSDADLEIFKQSLPRMINTPEGNRKIIETMKAINVYDRRLAQIASDAMAGDISRSEAREQIMAVPNPLRGFSVDDATPVEAGETPQGVDAEIWNAMTDEEKALWQN